MMMFALGLVVGIAVAAINLYVLSGRVDCELTAEVFDPALTVPTAMQQ